MLNKLRNWWKSDSKTDDERLPHEKYPRVLNWQKGDQFQPRNGKYWPDFYAGHATLIGITIGGDVFLQDSERKWHLSIDDVCENCWNLDASDRAISKKIKASAGYTQALSEFNVSVRELQQRDDQMGVDLPDDYYTQAPVDLYI